MSKMIDDNVAEKIRTKEIKWISPSIWPEENAVEIISETDGSTIERVHDYKGLHYAFVDEPAYETEAEIKAFCDGTTKACEIELAKFNASIDNVGPITDKKIILPNTSKQPVNTSHKKNNSSKAQMATDEELRKELEDAKKATEDIKKELEDLKSKKAQEDDEKKEDEKKAQNKEDDEEKKALKATVEKLQKIPIVEKIVSAQLVASIISGDKVEQTKSQLMNASVSELEKVYEYVKPFEAKLKSFSAKTSTGIPYMGSVYTDSPDYGSFDASVDDMDFDKLMEVTR